MPTSPYRAIAEYYDAENAHHRMLHEDVPFFMGQLPRRKQQILELAVGTARAAIPLAQAGHRVVGIDYAADMTYIFPRELQLLLERNGLQIDYLFGNYDGSPLTSASPRIIALCCRR
ncbi:MAG TPA: class I SAM-dependent methyltransferase [Tepidisphaeraceae bacterium]|nr:class I SAM-dependent methyltransferase [Tepidisphaeraceae bacterium]